MSGIESSMDLSFEGETSLFDARAGKCNIGPTKTPKCVPVTKEASLRMAHLKQSADPSLNSWKLQITLDSLPVAALVADQFGIIEVANLEMGKLLNAEPAELCGRLVSSVISERQKIIDPQASKVRTLAKVTRKNAEALAAETSESLIEVDGQEMTMIVLRDISVEEDQARSNHNFVAMVTHELKTPLSCVNGILSLLEEGVLGELTEQGLEMTQQVKLTCKRLVRLIDDLLDMEKIHAGKFRLNCKNLSVAAVSQLAIESVLPISANRDISYIGNADLSCYADEDRLLQVLGNLLSNSVKYSPAASAIIIQAEEEPGGMVKISVRDEGKGIPVDKADKIFGGDRVDVLESRTTGATGLGLSICRSIINHLGGSIGVCSKHGQGCVWFTLPKERK